MSDDMPISMGKDTGQSSEMNQHQQHMKDRQAGLNKIGMLDVRFMGMDWLVDMRYAGENNFVGRTLYPSDVCLLTKGTAQKLALAHKKLSQWGYRLKIWDAYRPATYQQILYDAAEDKRFVAHPRHGSKHSRGAAVDVTLVDNNGMELVMPTSFDAFVAQASLSHPSNIGQAKQNATLLKDIMVSVGFEPISNEWWHFDDTQWEDYPLTDHDLAVFETPL